MSTIFAQATAPGKSGVAIVRISGPLVPDVANSLCGVLPDSHLAKLRILRDSDGKKLDQALVLFFKGPNSFTGEDVLELHLHGSVAVVNIILKILGNMPGLRIAEPGEFTRRALENNKLDLAQVEGLADLIEAETEAQRRQALRVFSGALGDKAAIWREKTIRAAALIEATIDFADEDVPIDVSLEVLDLIEFVSSELILESKGSHIAERIRDGFEVAIVGAPNVGKSTLLNTLAGRDAAITSEHAGTTRDVIEVRMDLNGLPVTFLDTAGLRKTEDVVENIGIERAIGRAKAADIRVFLTIDGQTPDWVSAKNDDLVVHAKADLGGSTGLCVSGLTGQGVNKLIEQITTTLGLRAVGSQNAIRERHRRAIDQALIAFQDAKVEIQAGPERAEMAAEELRTVIRSLDALIGRVDVEEVLGEIFASFCLGK